MLDVVGHTASSLHVLMVCRGDMTPNRAEWSLRELLWSVAALITRCRLSWNRKKAVKGELGPIRSAFMGTPRADYVFPRCTIWRGNSEFEQSHGSLK